MRFLFTLSLLVVTFQAQSQTLIPYLGANGQYGYATEAGQVVLPATFDHLSDLMPAGQIYAISRADNKYQLVLRNGLSFPSNAYSHAATGACNYTTDGRLLDTLPHLVALLQNQKMALLDTRNQSQHEYLNPSNARNPSWLGEPYNYRTGLEPQQFRHGLLGVWKGPGQLNFVDTNLREVFSRDFAAGKVLDSRYVLVAESENHVGVADHSGRLLTPLTWRSVQPTAREGWVVVNADRFQRKNNAGLLNVATGQLVLDTVYSSIEAKVGNELLVVGRDGKFGLVDYTGREVVPFRYDLLNEVRGTRWLLAYGRPSQVFDSQGRPQLPDSVSNVYVKSSPAGKPYLALYYRDRVELCDTELRLIRSFTQGNNLDVWLDNPLIVKLQETAQQRRNSYDLYDAEGRALTQGDFQEITPLLPLNHFFRVTKDSLSGVVDERGREILPLKFSEMRIESFRNDTLIWTRERGKNLWSAYERTGRKVPNLTDRVAPSAVLPDLWVNFEQSKWGSDQLAAVLSDGRRVLLPDSLKGWQPGRPVQTPGGGLVAFSRYKQSQRESILLNEQLRNPVPRGYYLPTEKGGEYRPEITGLITVFREKQTPPVVSAPPPTPRPARKVEVVAEEQIMEVATVDDPAPQMEDTGPWDSCGVLNARGEWVLRPKAHVRYVPLSPYLVAELDAYEKLRKGENLKRPLRIHRVNQPETGVIEVNYLQGGLFEDGRTTTKFGKTFPKLGNRTLPAYFDEKGNQLTPYGVWAGPFQLKSRNLIAQADLNDPKLPIKWLIINEKGEKLAALPNLACSRAPHEAGGDWTFNYVVVQRQLPVEEVEKMNRMNLQQLKEFAEKNLVWQGILDSTGRLVQPLKYLRLQIVAPDRLFAAQDTAGQALLYNWKGEVLHTFAARPATLKNKDLYFEALAGGKWVVSDQHTTVLVSADNRVEQTYNSAFHGVPLNLGEAFFHLKTAEGKVFWVRTQDGRAYRE